ncbi:MAG: dienelactone hydrolase family protein [Acidimicrobiia bacterium]|nr:dienelactone hydrolase family protein [Acidimicrobiia bacterium]
MCFDLDSSPPIEPIAGGSVAYRDIELTAADGNRFAAFEASADNAAAVVVLPDVRGLFRFYEELALRFAEHGYDAVAIDYFGRTAGIEKRPSDWDYMPHVRSTTLTGVTADVAAAVDHLGSNDRPVFAVGFCFGGSNAWYMAATDLGLAGAVGFYGNPVRTDVPTGAPTVVSLVGSFSCPSRAFQGGADPGITPEMNQVFRDAITEHGVDAEVVEFAGAPHSFFDRKQDEYADTSADAWRHTLDFFEANR